MKNEKYSLGAFFIEVVCSECPSTIGTKSLHSIHKGYESQGAKPVTQKELDYATSVALKHEKHTGHTVRVIEGRPKGTIYEGT